MYTVNATDARQNWSSLADRVVREKPVFIKRTRDNMILSSVNALSDMLESYRFTAVKLLEEDGSVTLSLNELDLAENASTEKEAKRLLATAILDYAEDFYQDYALFSNAPNRKRHIPYVFKALILDDVNQIGELIQCRDGKN